MNPSQFKQFLIDQDACEPARDWAKGKSMQEAWDDWMFWLLGRVADKKEIQL